MNIEKVASDMAKKSYLSRKLGGVVKVGNYTAWAEKYQSLANAHYAKLLSEKRGYLFNNDTPFPQELDPDPQELDPNYDDMLFKKSEKYSTDFGVEFGAYGESVAKAPVGTKNTEVPEEVPTDKTKQLPMDPLLSHTLIGGGIGAGLGALGGLAGGVWKGKKLRHTLRDTLSYGLLGGLGGAGLGAAYKIYQDPNALDRAVTRAEGEPHKTYTNPALAGLDTEAKKIIAGNKSKTDQQWIGRGAAIGAGVGVAAPLLHRGVAAVVPQKFTPGNAMGVQHALSEINAPKLFLKGRRLKDRLSQTATNELIAELSRVLGMNQNTGAALPNKALAAMADNQLPRVKTLAQQIQNDPKDFFTRYKTAPTRTLFNPEGLHPRVPLLRSQRTPGPSNKVMAGRVAGGATGGGIVGGLTALGSMAYGFGNDPTKPSDELSRVIANAISSNISKVTNPNTESSLKQYLDLANNNQISPDIYAEILQTLQSIFPER